MRGLGSSQKKFFFFCVFFFFFAVPESGVCTVNFTLKFFVLFSVAEERILAIPS